MRERPPLKTVAVELATFGSDKLENVVERRVSRLPVTPLPPLHRDEDPSDILVDTYYWLDSNWGKTWDNLRHASSAVTRRWVDADAARIRMRPEPLGELLYLCARIGAVEAMPSIEKVIDRPDLDPVILPGGEDLKLRALRSLSGLLVHVSESHRALHRRVFEQRLQVRQHQLMALTGLLAFWPDDRERAFELLRRTGTTDIDSLSEQAQRNLRLLTTQR
jgi:hypothetical protein